MPIDLSTIVQSGTVREIALRMIAELKPGLALTALEIAARARSHPRSVTQCMADYPWKMTIRGEKSRSQIVYMSKATYEAHEKREGEQVEQAVAEPRPRRR